MSTIGSGSSQPLVQTTQKADAVENKTLLEKGVDVVKEKTAKGTLVGDHYVAAGALSTVGIVAAGAGIAQVADKVPAVAKGLHVLGENSKVIGGGVALAASVVLAQDAAKSFKDGKTVKGGAEATGAVVAGLGGTELVGRQFNIPYAKQALTATGEFIGKNGQAIIGGGTIAGAAVAITSGVSDIKDGKNLKGGVKIGSGAVAALGGTELIGRQFGIKYLDEALTGIPKAIFTSKGGMGVAGGLVAATGAVAGVDGVRRMTTGKGVINDALGTAEVTAATTAVTGGASLIGMATGNEALKKALPENGDVIGAVALTAGAVALGKYTVDDMKKKGVTVTNAVTGTGTGLAALGAVEVLGSKFGVPVAKEAFSKGWQPVVAVGLGAAAYKLGANAVNEGKDGKVVNALGQGAGAVVLGGGSLALVGNAFKIPGLENFGSKVLTTAADIASPVFKTAVEHPAVTLGAVAVASGVGVYAYYHNKN